MSRIILAIAMPRLLITLVSLICKLQVFLALFFASTATLAQEHDLALQNAFDSLSRKDGYQQANISFTLIDLKSGKILFEKNKDLSLPPASTLKTFTTASALHFLGPSYQFQTPVTFTGKIVGHHAYGELRIYGSGDPSLGSDRFNTTKPERIFAQIGKALKQAGFHTLHGKITVIDSLFHDEAVNAAWLEEDIGNYYGAGIHAFNWKENKFNLGLRYQDSTFVVSHNSAGFQSQTDFCIDLIAKEGTSTESAFAYLTPADHCPYTIRGFLPPDNKIQTIQLARIHPAADFKQDLVEYLARQFQFVPSDTVITAAEKRLCTLRSPRLDSLIYYCNQKSLNLYAEAFCKTIAVKLYSKGSWKQGISAMLRYAATKGIDTNEVSLLDASGLAPDNRISTHVLAQLMRAYTRETWYPSFYKSLPNINGLRMKSGYIGGTRSYTGYITLQNGQKACFAFIINKYSCTPQQVKLDMFALLDLLKPIR